MRTPRDHCIASSSLLPPIAGNAGKCLDSDVRAMMETRLGFPLDRVRIHHGPWASAATTALNARAFSIANHIVFGTKELDVSTPDGISLLAHELVHTIQQRETSLESVGALLKLGGSGEPSEHAAESIAAAVCHGEPVGLIQPEKVPVIRRALAIDLSSSKLSANKGSSVAAVHAGREFALLHCTTNVNLTVADGGAGRPTSGNMITFQAEVSFTADPKSNADRSELLTDWEFFFLQTSETLANEYEYAGRLATEGSVRINLKPGFVPNPCLDADESLTADFPFLQNTLRDIGPAGGPAARFTVKIESGDNPFGKIFHTGQNLNSKADNFMFTASRDERFVTLFLARNLRRGQIHFLQHAIWRVVWNAEFRWGVAGSKRVTNSPASAIDIVSVSAGPPADAKVLAILRNPRKPTANELDSKALTQAFTRRVLPFFEEFATYHITIPGDFFSDFSLER